MRIGVIGTGVIATAVVHGIAGDGHRITVSERSAANASALDAAYENVSTADNQTVLDQSDIVFLGLMAEQAAGVLGGLRFRPDQKVLTFMAGATKDEAAALVAPAQMAAIVMPYPGVAQGNSLVMMQGDAPLVREIFEPSNRVFVCSDAEELQAYLTAQAVLSPAARLVEAAADWLGQRASDKAAAEEFLRVLVGSSLLGSDCGPLLAALNTEGGYNQRLRLHMEQTGMVDALEAGLDALQGKGGANSCREAPEG